MSRESGWGKGFGHCKVVLLKAHNVYCQKRKAKYTGSSSIVLEKAAKQEGSTEPFSSTRGMQLCHLTVCLIVEEGGGRAVWKGGGGIDG